MKKLIMIFCFICFGSIGICQVKAPEIQFQAGLAHLNYKGIKNAFQTGFALNLSTKGKLRFKMGYDFVLGDKIKKDQLEQDPQIFNYNSQIQQNDLKGLLVYPITRNNFFKINILTGVSFNFLKQSYVNNIYYKEIFPNEPLVLVSESTFEKKFQLAVVSGLEAIFNFRRFTPGLSMQYQIQKEYQFISPSIFVSYKL